MSDDLTLKVLIEIRDEIKATRVDLRDEIKATNVRVDLLRTDTNQRFAETNGHLDQLRNELKEEHFESEVRHATRQTELTSSNRNLHAMLAENFRLRERVERCEADIAELKSSRRASE